MGPIQSLVSRWSKDGRDLVSPLRRTFAIILSIVIVASIISNFVRERELMKSKLTELDQAVVAILQHQKQVEADGLEKALLALAGNDTLRKAFIAADRDALHAAAAPLYAELRERHGVTHFNFIDQNRINILRMHTPERYGDKIDRYSIVTAAKSGKITTGLEIGRSGGLALRVVTPFFDGEQPIGFLELGIEIGEFLDVIEQSLGITIIEAYDKSIQNRDHWAVLSKHRSRESRWDASDQYVLSADDLSLVPSAIMEYFDAYTSADANRGQILSASAHSFHVFPVGLSNSTGREVGFLLIIREFTADIVAFVINQLIIIGIGIVLWFVASRSFDGVAANVQSIVSDTHSRLDREVSARTRELEASERRYREAQQVAAFGNWEWDASSNGIYWSDEVFQIYEMDREAFGGTREAFLETVHPDDREKVKAVAERAIQDRAPYVIDHRIVLPNGDIRHVSKHGTTEYAPDGMPVRMYGVVQDVTERIHAERALKESEELFFQAFHHSPALLAMVDAEDETFRDVNDAWLTAMEYSRDEVVGHSTGELSTWADRSDRDRVYDQLEKTGAVRAFETRFRTKNGKLIDILFSAVRVDVGGRKVYFGSCNDVTELRKAEDIGRRLARVMETSLNEIYIFDAETVRFIHVNSSATGNIGHSLEELSGLAPWDIKPEIDEAQFREMIEPLRRGEVESLRFETVHQRKNGTFYPVEVLLQLYSEETPAVFVAISNDITERKKSEDAVVELTQDLERRVEKRTEELRLAHQQLLESEKMVSLGGLVAGIAHEINTPIGIGVTAASYLHDRSGALKKKFAVGALKKSELEDFIEGNEESTSILLTNLQRASNLIRSFKQVSIDQLVEDHRTINMRDYLDQIVTSLRPELKRNAVRIKIDCPTDIEIDTYPGAISQIVTNLILNALLHAFELDGKDLIRIEVADNNGTVTLRCRDNGKGIAAEHLPKLFEPFFTTRRGEGGSGLGLNVVYNLVTQKLGGTVTCESVPGEGALFEITLPVLEVRAP